MLKKILILFTVVIFMTACSKKHDPKPQPAAQAAEGAHHVVVQEVVHVTGYTYIRVEEGEKEYWMAGPRTEINPGEVFTYNKAMEMKNFKSKELGRRFDAIFFVDSFSANQGHASMTSPQKPVITEEKVNIEKATDGITIAQLFSNPNSYVNRIVKIKGKVAKINSGIMDRNWVHIQDGTKSGNDFDLTVTTQEMVRKDDIVTFVGKIVLNKDFGYGYSYKVLMEDAQVESKPTGS
jgi:hypothetical protein